MTRANAPPITGRIVFGVIRRDGKPAIDLIATEPRAWRTLARRARSAARARLKARSRGGRQLKRRPTTTRELHDHRRARSTWAPALGSVAQTSENPPSSSVEEPATSRLEIGLEVGVFQLALGVVGAEADKIGDHDVDDASDAHGGQRGTCATGAGEDIDDVDAGLDADLRAPGAATHPRALTANGHRRARWRHDPADLDIRRPQSVPRSCGAVTCRRTGATGLAGLSPPQAPSRKAQAAPVRRESRMRRDRRRGHAGHRQYATATAAPFRNGRSPLLAQRAPVEEGQT